MVRGNRHRMRTFQPSMTSLVSYDFIIQAYGRRLTALILDNAHSHMGAVSPGAYEDDPGYDGDSVKSRPGTLPFGDSGQAKLFSVKCHKHK